MKYGLHGYNIYIYIYIYMDYTPLTKWDAHPSRDIIEIMTVYPRINVYITMEHHHFFGGKSIIGIVQPS